MTVRAVIFDLDGVVIDSEPVWEDVRRRFVAEQGGRWLADSQRRLMGMSTGEWAAYLAIDLGVPMRPDDVAEAVISRMVGRYEADLPLIPGAVEVVRALAARWPLGLASSSPRRLIDAVLARAGLASVFALSVSTEEVPRGKPAPDVYLEVARRLSLEPRDCVAVEDSSNGVRSAVAAGLPTVAVERAEYPLDEDARGSATMTLRDIRDLTTALLETLS